MTTATQIGERLNEAMARGDLEAVVGQYAPDAVMVGPEGTFRGAEQIEEYWRAFLNAFSDIEVAPLARIDGGETAVEEWTVTATHSGPLDVLGAEPIPATGRRLSVRGVDVVAAREGRIVEHRIYWDQMELAGQLGLAPAAA